MVVDGGGDGGGGGGGGGSGGGSSKHGIGLRQDEASGWFSMVVVKVVVVCQSLVEVNVTLITSGMCTEPTSKWLQRWAVYHSVCSPAR